ncbi:MAG: nucleoside hydrolase [Cyanobacteria bacterium P01_F01_bin.33]
MPTQLIIDCDPGVDDALAIWLALASPDELEILGISTVAGNVPLALTQANARKICECAGRVDIPVYAGCPRPLLRSLVTAADVHGTTGLDGAEFPEPQMPLSESHAVDWTISTLSAAEHPVTIAALGPLTNLAVALTMAPQISACIERVVVMGGACGSGNITPAAEFNMYVDPHAAAIVMAAGLNLTLITLDVTHTVITTPERLHAIRAIATPVARAAADLLEHYGQFDLQRYGTPGGFLHDPCTIAYLLAPDLFHTVPAWVAVETAGELTLGKTVVDRWSVGDREPNVTLVTAIDADGFYQLLCDRLQHL